MPGHHGTFWRSCRQASITVLRNRRKACSLHEAPLGFSPDFTTHAQGGGRREKALALGVQCAPQSNPSKHGMAKLRITRIWQLSLLTFWSSGKWRNLLFRGSGASVDIHCKKVLNAPRALTRMTTADSRTRCGMGWETIRSPPCLVWYPLPYNDDNSRTTEE
jgi:hypothetical protein